MRLSLNHVKLMISSTKFSINDVDRKMLIHERRDTEHHRDALLDLDRTKLHYQDILQELKDKLEELE